MPFMTRIPSDLARFGLPVELLPGWETRGSSAFAPAGVVDHWTAGPRGTTGRPSLNVCTYGRAGIPGPLCNVYFDRRGVCVVVAAGRANHAGVGGYRGLVGNSAVYGIEAECGGDGDWTSEQRRNYPRLNAALLSGLGRDASWCLGHNDWAPTRKIDIRDIIRAVQAETATILAGGGETQKEWWEMPIPQAEIEKIAQRTRQVIADGQLPYGLDSLRRRMEALSAQVALADANDAPSLVANAVIAALPETGSGEGGTLTRADVEGAVRDVLGGLDDAA